MPRIFKVLGFALAVIVGLAAAGAAVIFVISGARLSQSIVVDPVSLIVPTDPESIERGRYIASTFGGCFSCHGTGLEGDVLADDPALGTIVAPNLTGGKGGRPLAEADFVRAVRHGVGENGRPLLIMPSADLYYLDDQDLAAVVAYASSLDPVDTVLPETSYGPMGRLLIVLGPEDFLAALKIDHETPPPAAPPVGATAAYGRYLAQVGCMGCHTANLGGGSTGDPASPPASDLTKSGPLANWTEADFIRTLRTGQRPDGSILDADFMPWVEVGQMADDDLMALLIYFQSLPPANP